MIKYNYFYIIGTDNKEHLFQVISKDGGIIILSEFIDKSPLMCYLNDNMADEEIAFRIDRFIKLSIRRMNIKDDSIKSMQSRLLLTIESCIHSVPYSPIQFTLH